MEVHECTVVCRFEGVEMITFDGLLLAVFQTVADGTEMTRERRAHDGAGAGVAVSLPHARCYGRC